MEPVANPVPKHIGVIIDGNRRFAKRLMAKPWKGHEWGAKKVERLLHWCKELGVEELTLYSFSIQNFDRPKNEFDTIMGLFRENLERFISEEQGAGLRGLNLRVTFIGRLSLFPRDIQDLMQNVMDATKDNKGYMLNFAVGYGGREEVVDAVRKLAKQVKDGKLDPSAINERIFSDALYMASEPDLIIRTGGEHRTSNFLIWQSNYAEWVFYDKKLWPEFEKEDFLACIEDYRKRHRRFGK